MKHIAIIHTEFLKNARLWNELSREQKRDYLTAHPHSRKTMSLMLDLEDKEGIDIADRLGVFYNGLQEGFQDKPDLHVFTDPETATTFLARNLEEAEHKLAMKRKEFDPALRAKHTEAETEREPALLHAAQLRKDFCKFARSL
jgi:hypothetical protein